MRRTFQQLKVFPNLSVRDNLLAAAQSGPGFSAFAEVLRTTVRAPARAHPARARGGNSSRSSRSRRTPVQLAAALSYGQKKLLELAMALMTDPQVLLLDEPVAGVNPTLIEALKRHLVRVRDRGVTLLIVEHNLKLVFDLCERIFVLDGGRLLTSGAAGGGRARSAGARGLPRCRREAPGGARWLSARCSSSPASSAATAK